MTFNVYRSETSGGEGSTPYATTADHHLLDDTDVQPGQTYYYQVSAVLGSYESPRSSEVHRMLPVLAAPVLAGGANFPLPDGVVPVALLWNDPDPGASAIVYNVYQSTTQGGEGATPYLAADMGPLLYVNALPGSTYFYQVSAVVAGFESPRSNEVQVSVPALAAPVLTGANNFPLPGGVVPVSLLWNNPEQGTTALAYNVYRSTTQGGEGATPYMAAYVGSFLYVNALPGSTYFYQVSAVVGSYESPRSNEFTAAVPALAAPVLTGANNFPLPGGVVPVSLLWNNPEQGTTALAYNVYRSTTQGGEGATPYMAAYVGSFLYVNALPGSTYFYQVSAVVGSYESPRSNEFTAAVPALAAPVLDGGESQPLPDGQAIDLLMWTNPEQGATALAYNVYQSTTQGGEGATPIHASYVGQLLIVNALPGSTYFYQVSAVVGSYESPRSNEVQVSARTVAAPVLSATASNPMPGGQVPVLLTWNNPDPGTFALAYNVYRSTIPGGEGATPYQAAYVGLGLPVTALPGSTYFYQVSVVVGSYESPRSNEVKVTVPAPAQVAVRVEGVKWETLKQIHKKAAKVLVVSYSAALNTGDAETLAAYRLVTAGKDKKLGTRDDKLVKLTSATYNATAMTVTLTTKSTLPKGSTQLSINTALTLDAQGQPIDSDSNGQPGGTFQASFGKTGIRLAGVSAAGAGRGVSAKGADALLVTGDRASTHSPGHWSPRVRR